MRKKFWEGMTQYAGRILLALAVSSVCYSEAWALPTIKFDQVVQTSGTISYDGSTNLVGSNINFSFIVGQGTSLNNGVVLDCIGCELNFVTGNNTLEPGSIAVGGNYEWAGGGSFVLTTGAAGGVFVSGSGNAPQGGYVVGQQLVGASTSILSGSWTGHISGDITPNATSLSISGGGPDTKDQAITSFYGFSTTDFTFLNSEISLSSVSFDSITKGFSGDVTNADINNTAVPEPSSLLLLGSGLVGLGLVARRRRQAQKA